jgi:hypothetical protein
MTDRELLELAAKAAGVEIATWSNCQAGGFLSKDCAPERRERFWNPLTDDGDALRLAVNLRLTVHTYDEDNSPSSWGVSAGPAWADECVPHDSDPYAATRRAVVRAAAAIGQPQAASGVDAGSAGAQQTGTAK